MKQSTESLSTFSLNVRAAEEQSDNKYKYILFMKTSWSKQSAQKNNNTAFDSGGYLSM